MLTPFLVEYGQNHLSLQITHLGFATDQRDGFFQLFILSVGIKQNCLQQIICGKLTGCTELSAVDKLLNRHGRAVQGFQGMPEGFQIPVLHIAVHGGATHVSGDGFVNHGLDVGGDVGGFENFAPFPIDHLALLIHDLVVFEHVFPHFEVLVFHLGLGTLDGISHHFCFDRHIVRDVEPIHHILHGLTNESHHEVITHGQVEAGQPGVTLTAGTATQLIVNAAGLMPFGAEHVQATGFTDLFGFLFGLFLHLFQLFIPRCLVLFRSFDGVEAAFTQVDVGNNVWVAAQHNVSTTTSHVGSHGHLAGQTGASDDLGFLLVEFSVENIMLDVPALQQLREVFRTLHRGGAHQNRLPLGHTFRNVLHHRGEFGFLGFIHQVSHVYPLRLFVGRNRHHIKLVDLVQLGSFGFSGAGHAGKLVIKPEVIL